MRKRFARCHSISFVCGLLLFALLFPGCAEESVSEQTPAQTQTAGGLWLDISAEEGMENGVPSVDLPVSKTGMEMAYYRLKNVKIKISGAYVPIEEAVSSGQITPEEVLLYARLDAAEGNCEEAYGSFRGVTHFYYTYPAYMISVVHDVLETPTGKQHLISSITIEKPYKPDLESYSYYDDDMTVLDREDWGIVFEAADVSATGMILRCTQADGQHIGRLVVDSFMLFDEQSGTFLSSEKNTTNWFSETVDMRRIDNDAVTDITLTWEYLFGSLPSGKYRIRLRLTDIYDPETVHPLMVNYYDSQSYYVEFSVP